MVETLRIAAYMRLSREDAVNREESNSIRMQRMLLTDYAAARFEHYHMLEYVDDGYTGTNFDRPGVRRMLRGAKESLFDCIIVKDFSRFSRDYIELGTYIDRIFPLLGIRFISVNDQYDSANGTGVSEELELAFKNLLYDLYSKDLSVKVKASLSARKEKGQYVCGNSPFGYEAAAYDKHLLVPVEEEAAVVRRIFELALEGRTSVQIAKILNREGIKTPVEYKIEKGKTSRAPKGDRFTWSSSVICGILKNEVYTGSMVYGKYYRQTAGGKNHLKPRKEWKVYRDHHEPIIDREVFERIQVSRGRPSRKEAGERHPLTGILTCGCCGKNLGLRKGSEPYFTCPDRYINMRKGCVVKVNAVYLEQYVLHAVRLRMQETEEPEKLYRDREGALGRNLRKLEKQRQDMAAKRKVLIRKKLEAYEQYAAGKMDLALYREINYSMIEAQKEAKAAMESTGEKIREIRRGLSGKQDISGLSADCGLAVLTEAAVRTFVEKIVVYAERHVEIAWKEKQG